MAVTPIYRACFFCSQTGVVPMEEASPGDPPNPETKTCPSCNGELWILEGGVDLSGVLDVLDDVKDKIDDIKEKVDEIKEVVDEL